MRHHRFILYLKVLIGFAGQADVISEGGYCHINSLNALADSSALESVLFLSRRRRGSESHHQKYEAVNHGLIQT